ncbi:MAG: alpha/beta fold hydrolase [Solirubrobacterales bacterium]|nr:alpha/beta fold hydrolase [Solirubrobacterales bacterium]
MTTPTQPERPATATATALEARARLVGALPVDEIRLEIEGISTVLLAGGDGPPIVFLHGPGGNAAHWMRVIPDLVATNRVIAPDLPGQGASELDEAPLDGERALAWLGALIEETCEPPPALVGNALGGAIAARFAARAGERVGRLVLVDALGLADFDPAPPFGAALDEFLNAPGEQTHDGLWAHCAHDLDRLRGDMGDGWDRFKAYNVDRATTPSVAAALGALMGEFGFPAIPAAELERIAVPTSVIWGHHDLATRLAAAESACERYGWPLRVIEDCADDPPVEQPEAFLAALREALGEDR